MKTSCVNVPDAPNGKPSTMYKDMVTITKSRPLTNLLYGIFKSSDASDKMEAAGYKKNLQGEFDANDALKFLGWGTIQNEITNVSSEERRLGYVDLYDNRVDFTDAESTLKEAANFNANHKGLVAYVYKHGSAYNIYVTEKNSRTFTQAIDVRERLAAWDIYKQFFNTVGIDITALPTELSGVFNAYNPVIAQYLINLQNSPIDFLNKNDALTLFNMDKSSPQVQRLVGAFGSIENAAQAVYEINSGTNSYDSAKRRLLKNAIEHCQKFQGLDLEALKSQVDDTVTDVKNNSPEQDIAIELHKLRKKYNIDINEIHLIDSNIRSLSQAAAEAALQLQRKLREIESKQGDVAEGKRIEETINRLLMELNNKKYYSGILDFLSEAMTSRVDVQNKLESILKATLSGTNMEIAYQQAQILTEIKAYKDMYYPVISALADEKIIIDESIDTYDIQKLREEASKVKKYFDDEQSLLERISNETMEHLLQEIIGDTAPNGESIANLVKLAQADTTKWDYLYSIARSSNAMIAAMGSVIQNAQAERNETMNAFSLRIRRATDKLYSSGSTSEFMYEEDGIHVISDIDWGTYNAERKAQIKALAKSGLDDFDLKIAIQAWEEANTEERVVDTTNGRTERVPDSKYRKPFPTLTPAQKEYYDTMMQIKGEIGSFLPAYAQKQYLVPQVRREMLDAIGQAKGAYDVWKAIKNKFEDIYTIRENDPNYPQEDTIVVDGEVYSLAESDYDNTVLRKIPIFYINQVEKGELLKEFSTGLQHLAGTAINYKAMSSVQDVVEFMGDFVEKASKRDTLNRADMVDNRLIRVVKGTIDKAQSSNCADIVRGFIDYHVYGIKRSEKEPKGWQKLCDSIIGYTSFKGLSTNVKGALSNYLVGEFQMLIEAGCGEFYGVKDYAWAHTKLFGKAGVSGEIMELLTNNRQHKATLMRDFFDPMQEEFSDKSRERYYPSWFRQMLGHDCSFIGYASGEYLIHYVNMYAVLCKEKVKLNGQIVSLYDVLDVGNIKDNNAELVVKAGATKLDGSPIDKDYLLGVKNKIKYVNQSTHGAMNAEDKGLIHRRLLGRLAMNFRQWMVEHYSRRFRGKHFDASLGTMREGYWRTVLRAILKDGEAGQNWREHNRAKAVLMFFRDALWFSLRAQSQWKNLDQMQRRNVRRAQTEFHFWLAMCGLSVVLGEPEDHKKDWQRRWWIYQVKRILLETEASMPHPGALGNLFTILNSPAPGLNFLQSLFEVITNVDDIGEEVQSGPHKGEDKYWRKIKRNVLPFYKDIEQMQELDDSDALFQTFDK